MDTLHSLSGKKMQRNQRHIIAYVIQPDPLYSTKKKRKSLMFRGDCSLNIVLYYRLTSLEETDKRFGGILTGRQVLFNKAICRASGLMSADHTDSSSLCDKRL